MLKRGAVDVDFFRLFGMPLLSVPADGTYELGGSGATELSESVWLLLLASALAAVLLTEEVDDGGTPYAKSSQGENYGFDWWSSGAASKPKKAF